MSEDMVHAAKMHIEKNDAKKIRIIQANSFKLPFPDHTFDVISCMVSRWDVQEIARVLKPDGVVVIEHIGCEDKKDFKIMFGKDDEGWRGQFLDFQKEAYLESFDQAFHHYFNSVTIKNGFWRTHYSEEEILGLLQYTPTIRNFNVDRDCLALQTAIDYCKTDQGITLMQNRILIHAKNDS